MKSITAGKRYRREINPNYTSQASPRLKQLYFDKYLSIKAQHSVRWTDLYKTGISTCPGLFIHALAMPAFIKAKGISKWPLLTLTGFVLSHLLQDNPYPTVSGITKLLSSDHRTIGAAVIWCRDRNLIGFVNNGTQGRTSKGRLGGQKYYLTLKGQELLNEYYAFCHIYYDQISDKLSDASKRIG